VRRPRAGGFCHYPDQRNLPRGRIGGLHESELIEAITHLAFYACWPKAMSAMAVAKQVFRSG
jgi:4-carboxymuconolactone decarboxylase